MTINGRMTVGDVDQYLTVDRVRALYGDADSVHDFDHILRVVNLAERIARQEGADLRIVRAAALLHDLGRAESQAQDMNHAAVAAERAGQLLSDWGAPRDWISAVQHAIAAHRFRALPDPQSLEAQVVFDADKLDAIGAIGIARVFAYGGAHQQRLWASRESIDVAEWEMEGDASEHTPVHEFIVKLSRIKDRLTTRSGRAIAEERHSYMQAYYQRLDAEVRGEK
ncbi:MAG: HD domain-containing protein [Anaerolineales bacterium]|nr:MAG: HD domain-containing protein [Anaerolineales bacterium]